MEERHRGYIRKAREEAMEASLYDDTAPEPTQRQGAGAAPPAAPLREWLVWSYEHDAWWGPDRCGYYSRRAQAGRYTKEQADQIVRNANYGGVRNEAAIYDPLAQPPAPQEGLFEKGLRELLAAVITRSNGIPEGPSAHEGYALCTVCAHESPDPDAPTIDHDPEAACGKAAALLGGKP